VINYNEMIKSISEVAEDEQYYTKSMANNVIKLTCTTPDTYRILITHFKEKGIYHHTYQLKEERTYRVASNTFTTLPRWKISARNYSPWDMLSETK